VHVVADAATEPGALGAVTSAAGVGVGVGAGVGVEQGGVVAAAAWLAADALSALSTALTV
jgi:hypothetical protein